MGIGDDDFDSSEPVFAEPPILNEPTLSYSEHRKPKRRRERVRLQEGSRIREPGSTDPEAEPFTENENSGGGNKPSTLLGLASAFNIVKRVSDKMSAKKQGKVIKC